MNFIELLSYCLQAFVENIIWYTAFISPFFLIFWVYKKQYWKKRRIQTKEQATPKHFRHDLYYSIMTFIVSAFLIGSLYYLDHLGYTLVYWEGGKYSYLWLFLSLAVVLFIDDSFFYWSHRAMHQPLLYRYFHRVHHKSTDPSPLTSFSFAPSEAVVEHLVYLILPFILPLNFWVIVIWQIFSMLNNVLGHLGYELYPKKWTKIPFLKYKTTSTHHNMHHQHFHGNYALYFTFWDKWMGTEFEDYEQQHSRIFEREEIKQLDTAPT